MTRSPEPDAPRVSDGIFLICALSWAAALIHVAAAISHLQGYALHSVFFEILASLQLLWGIALYRGPSRRLLLTGVVGNLLVVALWIVSRTSGLPIGPHPWRPEALGALDAVCSADEMLLAALVVFHVRGDRAGALLRVSRQLTGAAAICLLVASSLALTAAGTAHVH
jgi:hypothetical protein